MSAAERAYRLMLRAYPSGFRKDYGQQMALLFQDRHREAGATRLSFWAAVIYDVARSAPALRLEAARAWCRTDIQIMRGKMKAMAILTIVIGAIEVVNSAVEAWLGGIVRHGGASLAGGAMGVVAGALLVAAAIALLRRSSGAAALATAAAVTCLTVFALVLMLRPMFSIFSTALGIGFPIVLMVFLRTTPGKGKSVPTMT